MICPACTADDRFVFHEVAHAPVHSVLLLDNRDDAIGFKAGSIQLAFCKRCGFIWNAVFEPTVHEYGARYEPTQGYSPTFNRFHQALVDDLIDRFQLRNKHIIEIGCGQGEFLQLICQRGNNSGIGFDPAYSAERSTVSAETNLQFIQDFYSDSYADHKADFFACKMTLEHIADVASFVGNVRAAIGEQTDAIVFFQVPAIERILEEAAFWDIYYEHCSYFSLGSFARLFRSQGFEIVDLWRDYGDQYLMLAARPAEGPTEPRFSVENDLSQLAASVEKAAARIKQSRTHWQTHLKQAAASGETVVLWGGGSKAVAFLTTVDVGDAIRFVVDINPHKRNTYIAGTGQKIVTPDMLPAIEPDRVVIMNPVYRDEISAELTALNLNCHIETVADPIEPHQP